jgi:HAD superfamily hydrolase (TIGR01509 family)
MASWPGAVLFDFDGVIVDSEELHMSAYVETAPRWEIPLTREVYFRELIGFDDRGAWSYLFRKHGRPLDSTRLQQVIEEKLIVTRRLMSDGEFSPLPGVKALVDRLRSQAVPTAICTGALREEVETMLKGIGLRGHFDVVVAAEDVLVGKPNAAGYLLTMKLISERIGRTLTPSECLVIEDAPSVVRSVKQAGFRTVGVATTYPPSAMHDADWVVSSLDPDELDRIVPELRST